MAREILLHYRGSRDFREPHWLAWNFKGDMIPESEKPYTILLRL